MKTYFIEKTIDLQSDTLKPGWLKKHLQKTEDGICAFEGNYCQLFLDQPDLSHQLTNCLHIISEHKSVSYKETVTLMECLFLHLNQVLDTDLEYKENTILLEKKLLGHYQVNTRFRSGFIHIMLFNTPQEETESEILSLCDYDINAKSTGLNVIQNFNDSIYRIHEGSK